MAVKPFASADSCKAKVTLCQETAQVDQGNMYCFRIVTVRKDFETKQVDHSKPVDPMAQGQTVAWDISANGYKIDFPMPILHPSQYGGINLTAYLTCQCSRNSSQSVFKLTKHIQVKGFGLFFWNSYSVSNNIWGDNESKIFEILMETNCSDLALSLHAPAEFRIPLAPTERGDKLLFR